MPNMKISKHNHKVKKEVEKQSHYGCNCTKGIGDCPLGGNCLVNSVIYKAEVLEDNSNRNTYTGLTSNNLQIDFTDTEAVSTIAAQNTLQPWPHMCGT